MWNPSIGLSSTIFWKPKLLWGALVLGMAAGWLCSCQTPSQDKNVSLSHTHFLLGDDYLRKKMPSEARRELLKAIELNAENKDAHQLLGILFFLEAIQKINILERERCLKGEAATEQRQEITADFHRSEEHLRIVIALSKRENRIESEALNYLANIAIHFKRYEEAISFSQEALGNILYSARHVALGTLGWVYYKKGDLKNAARELRQAVYHEPRFCIGRYRLAKVYYDQKQFEAAFDELELVVKEKGCPIQEALELMGLVCLKVSPKHVEQTSCDARYYFTECYHLHPKSCVAENCRQYEKLL